MNLLHVRSQKKRKAKFVRDGFHHTKLSDTWRRPRGRHSKKRHKMRCAGAIPQAGYNSPKAVKGLHPCGLKDVLIRNENDLIGLKPEEHAVRFASTFGKLKKTQLLDKVDKMGLKVLNR